MPSVSPLTINMKEVNGNVGVNQNHITGQRPYTPPSTNPLDNEILDRHPTCLSDFSDYVDLVKRHLMYAVREEVEILKQQIGEMVDRIGQLEYENTVLRSEARPETLNKLQQPRSTQTSQISVPSSNVSTVTSPNLQQLAPQSSQQQLPQQPTS
uniref:Uncharacterized protein n=1 Tax=Arion vulgaris TaxID=1028688 RepID=A0A0B7BIT6_9EUPU